MKQAGIQDRLANPRARHCLDEHLDDVAAVLRLDDSRRATAERAAQELSKWLATDSKLMAHSPILYPQGSFLIRTTVRPRRDGEDRDEFDLDMVVELRIGWYKTPDELFSLIWRRIRDHPKYGKHAEKRRRCVCVNFPGEFHMDVLPARPDEARRENNHVTAIEVPDRKLHDWKESDPRGFATWFEQRSRTRVQEHLASAALPPMLQDEQAALDALRRSVQLTKRHRDVKFNGDDDAPRSIVLTTLLADYYYGHQSTFLALRDSVGRIDEWASCATGVPHVLNPVNEEENFAEAWDDHSFALFKTFMNRFAKSLVALEMARGPIAIGEQLELLFDEQVAMAAMKRYGKRQAQIFERGDARYEPKEKGKIVTSNAAIAAFTAKAIPKGTNFGA